MKTTINNKTAAREEGKRSGQTGKADIFQAFKHQTTQLAQNEEPVQAKGEVAQLATYSKKLKATADITAADMANWNTVRAKLGAVQGGDPRDIGKKVNDSLKDLNINTANTAMGAHMIPDRIGGAGNATNVMPWDSAFENGKWKTDVENKFDTQVAAMKKDEEISYTVNTTEMTDGEADSIIAKSAVAAEKAKVHHKERIRQIPVKVNATVGASTLSDTNETFINLIKP